MTTRRLIALYGWRYTPFARLAGLVVILLFGIFIAFSKPASDPSADINIEQAG